MAMSATVTTGAVREGTVSRSGIIELRARRRRFRRADEAWGQPNAVGRGVLASRSRCRCRRGIRGGGPLAPLGGEGRSNAGADLAGEWGWGAAAKAAAGTKRSSRESAQ